MRLPTTDILAFLKIQARRSNFMLNVFAGTVLAICLLLLLIAPLRINPDVSLFLIMGDMLLDGAVPYVDYVTINFPMAQYVHVPVVLLSRWLRINPIPIFNLGMFLLTVVAMGIISYLLVKKHVPALDYFAASVLLGIALLTLHLIAIGDYGQREHLMFLLILPGVILRWLRWQGQASPPIWLAVLIGIMAGIGANIKPHFLLVPVTVEIYALIRYWKVRSLLKPEAFAFAAIVLLYSVHFLLIPTPMREGMINIMLAASKSYSTMLIGDFTVQRLFFMPGATLTILIAPFLLRGQQEQAEWSLIQFLSIAGLAGLVVFAVQRVGIRYQALPANSFALLIAVVVLLHNLRQWLIIEKYEMPANLRRVLTSLPAILVLMLYFLYWSAMNGKWLERVGSENTSKITQYIQQHSSEGDHIYMAINYEPAFTPIVQAGRKMGGRFFSPYQLQWSLDGIIDAGITYTPDFLNSPEARAYLRQVAEDIRKYQPKLVLLYSKPGLCLRCPTDFAVGDFLLAHRLREDVLMPNYTQLANIEGYYVFQRSSPPTTPMQAPIRFGEHLLLTAWDIPTGTEVTPCSDLTLKSLWQVDGPIDQILSASVVLASDTGGITNMDMPPANFPPKDWKSGVSYQDVRALQLPCDLAPGNYSLLVTVYSLYDLPGATNLVVTYPDGSIIGNHFFITQVTVTK